MKSIRSLLLASLMTVAGLAAFTGSATAGPVLWSGSGSNDVGPATILFSVQNGNAKLKTFQAIMACTDTSDGSESDRAFFVFNGPTDALSLNRFSYSFSRSAGGRVGQIRLNGRLGSNGRGTARLNLTAVARDFETDAVIERCQATVDFNLRRGRTT